MSKVLVTGATGVIGAAAVRQLCERGDEVVGLDLFPVPERLGSWADRVPVIRGDMTEPGLIGRIMKTHGVTRVLHLAAFLSAESLGDPMKAVRVNALGTGALLDVASLLGIERVCVASTIGVYGPPSTYGGRVVTEDDPPSPSTPYGVSKLACEIACRIHREQGLDVVVVRPAVTYGPGRFVSLSGEFNEMIRDVALGRPARFPLWPGGPEHGRIQAIHTEDMAAAFVAATVGPPTADLVFNAPTVEAHTVAEVAAMLAEVVPGAAIEIPHESSFVTDPFPVVDGSRAIERLGVTPRYSLREGLEMMVAYYRANGGEA